MIFKRRWLTVPVIVAAIYTYQSFDSGPPFEGLFEAKEPAEALQEESSNPEKEIKSSNLSKPSDAEEKKNPEPSLTHDDGGVGNDTAIEVKAGAKKERTTSQDNVEENTVLLDVPYLLQLPELQRGCEVTSLAMMLQHAGVNVGKMELAENIHKVPYWTADGYRGNPHKGFVGNIYTFEKDGYAVYHEPIADLAETYLPGRIVDLSGQPFQTVLDQVKQGSPVLVITNSKFRPLPEDEFRYWKTNAGEVKITWNEHAVVITGYSDEHIYINNPLGGEDVKLNKESFIGAWKQLGSQAVSYN
ncbi:C39 family peptidase [Pseudalkalibacillus decolorationis]|uniref:C39 family peptidase n=1 Tax=Pseudalkalibacillus decolorationis TaxID=163879 RepID=UPI0021478200|nr:C39 family peptidase [Pseudalkalibacillus decolorationis]